MRDVESTPFALWTKGESAGKNVDLGGLVIGTCGNHKYEGQLWTNLDGNL